jgi:hypothetical protein
VRAFLRVAAPWHQPHQGPRVASGSRRQDSSPEPGATPTDGGPTPRAALTSVYVQERELVHHQPQPRSRGTPDARCTCRSRLVHRPCVRRRTPVGGRPGAPAGSSSTGPRGRRWRPRTGTDVRTCCSACTRTQCGRSRACAHRSTGCCRCCARSHCCARIRGAARAIKSAALRHARRNEKRLAKSNRAKNARIAELEQQLKPRRDRGQRHQGHELLRT